MKSTRVIVWASLGLYALALTTTWIIGTHEAERKTRHLLRQSQRLFGDVLGDSIDTTLYYLSAIVMDSLGNTCHPVSEEELNELAEKIHLDEINVVDATGKSVGSNIPSVLGVDFTALPETAEFLETLRGKNLVSQPFRPGAANPEMICRYVGVAFPDRSGFVQLGFNISRYSLSLSSIDPSEFLRWKIGETGHFDIVDLDGDSRPDRADNWTGREVDYQLVLGPNHESFYCREFVHAGLKFKALVSKREFHSQRDQMFWATALGGLLVLGLLIYFFIRLVHSSEKLQAFYKAEDERRGRDLSVARTVQMSALPTATRAYPTKFTISLAAKTIPAREVGGDFYDFYLLGEDHLVVLVADVAGKGIPAALFMMNARSVLRATIQSGGDLASAIQEANRRLCGDNEAQLFVTAWVGIVDLRGGVIEYVNAGHNRPYVRRASGLVEKLSAKCGTFLAMFPEANYVSRSLKLETGDELFLYTDGITEAMNSARQTFGVKRLENVLARPSSDFCETVLRAVEHFSGNEQSDDRTILTLRWNGKPSLSEKEFPCEVAALEDAVSFVRTALGEKGDRRRRSRLLNAVDESLSNIVNYSGASSFKLTVKSTDTRALVKIEDQGRAYDPLKHIDPNVSIPLEERPIGGLGILMVRKLVDYAIYRHVRDTNELSLFQWL